MDSPTRYFSTPFLYPTLLPNLSAYKCLTLEAAVVEHCKEKEVFVLTLSRSLAPSIVAPLLIAFLMERGSSMLAIFLTAVVMLRACFIL